MKSKIWPDLPPEKHLERFEIMTKHHLLVFENCLTMSKALIIQDRAEIAKDLMVRAYSHDVSKWSNIEYYGMISENKDMLAVAIDQHHSVNPHHIEFHEEVASMSELDIIEMVCDIRARAAAKDGSAKAFIKSHVEELGISTSSKFYRTFCKYIKYLIEDF